MSGVNPKPSPSKTQPAVAPVRAPQSLYLAAGIAVVQSIAVICFGIFLVVRNLSHADNESMVFDSSAPGWVGIGTAVFLFICFGFVIAGAFAMLRGKKWGRGAIVLLELILACSSFQMMTGGAVALGIAVLASAIVTLILTNMVPASVQWAESNY
ncbi:hypothetical protein [uncultured Corynebacterium sp.]|uniref:hypothetical protein n=1 Tax=uncultured Corynebacterium sp. TaxID=159447 RepID=UPI0025DDE25C|nr:hypothetical protein [uncultured Corynebacterium sp.]